MRSLPALVLLAACTRDPDPTPAAACAPALGAPTLDAWGGDTRADLGGTGFFRVEQVCGRWWLVDPEGHPFIGTGVNSVHPAGATGGITGVQPYRETTAALYESDAAWAEATAARMRAWGLTTAGSWSWPELMAPHLPVAIQLGLAEDDWLAGALVDYWDPAFEAAVAARVAAVVGPWAGDPAVLGWFLDNEVKWGPDWRGAETLLQIYLALPSTAPGKAVAVDAVIDAAGGLDAAAALLGTPGADRDALLALTSAADRLAPGRSEAADAATTAFLAATAERYFAVTAGAVRAADADHMILGNRDVALMTRIEVHDAAARHVDVISMNAYTYRDGVADLAMALSGGLDPADAFAALAARHDLPILVSELGFRAADSGLPNTWPPIYPVLDTQEDRADALEAAVGPWIDSGRVVGAHWFQWVDQPHEGRFDGEDNNWGLVSHADVPYAPVVDRWAALAARWRGTLELPTPWP